jgi:hypothetical protein
MARVIAAQFPKLPATGELATALREDLNAPVYADAYSSADYRLEVAPVVIRRATRLMTLAAAA